MIRSLCGFDAVDNHVYTDVYMYTCILCGTVRARMISSHYELHVYHDFLLLHFSHIQVSLSLQPPHEFNRTADALTISHICLLLSVKSSQDMDLHSVRNTEMQTELKWLVRHL